MSVEVNDVVGRIKYGCDVLFRVIMIKEIDGKSVAVLHGEDIRLIADAPLDDLLKVAHKMRSMYQSRNEEQEQQSLTLFSQERELLKQKIQLITKTVGL